MTAKVFLSFVQEDLNLVNLFRGQAKNSNIPMDFYDHSLKEPFNSSNAEYIKRGIAEKIKMSSLTICLCGSKTYTSQWVDWELRKSLELGKPIMGVKLSTFSIIYPQALIQYNAPIVEWNIPSITQTINRLMATRR